MFLSNSSALYFGSIAEPNETYLPLLEKAYAKAHGDYASIMNGWVGEGLEDLTGGVTFEIPVADILDKDAIWHHMTQSIYTDALFTAYFTRTITATSRDEQSISILRAAEVKGERLLLLRSTTEDELRWTGPWSDGSPQWTPEWMQDLGHRFGNPEETWMSYQDFLRQFEYINCTRIFDSEWSLSQQWAAFTVPKDTGVTKSKFQVTINSASQIIIALSQLDARYFQGLQSRYTYTLSFALSTTTSEYLLQTRHTYTLTRSCAVEANLEPGTYIIHPRITATKLPPTNTIANLLADENEKKREKLFRVALSRDLAYAKVKVRNEDTGDRGEEGDRDGWNAVCNLGLKVYVKGGDSSVEVLWDGVAKEDGMTEPAEPAEVTTKTDETGNEDRTVEES